MFTEKCLAGFVIPLNIAAMQHTEGIADRLDGEGARRGPEGDEGQEQKKGWEFHGKAKRDPRDLRDERDRGGGARDLRDERDESDRERKIG